MSDDFESAWKSAMSDLQHDLDEASTEAAQAGIDAVKTSHPYTDRTGNLTGTAHQEKNYALGGADMVWGEDYAGYVDGKPAFNFTDKASTIAEAELRAKVEGVSAKLASNFGG